MPLEMDRLTREYVWHRVSTPDDLATATADIAYMDDPAVRPDGPDWITADLLHTDSLGYSLVLEGAVYTGWVVRILVGPGGDVDLVPPGAEKVDYETWLRINDNPEIPVRRPGVLTIL